MTKQFYRIREVAQLLDVSESTLRYWEDEFSQLVPDRSPKGTRRYMQGDIEICRLIKHLLRDKGYSIEYARRELDVYRKYPPRNAFVCETSKDALNLLCETTKMIDGNPHAEARIKAVEKWIKKTIKLRHQKHDDD